MADKLKPERGALGKSVDVFVDWLRLVEDQPKSKKSKSRKRFRKPRAPETSKSTETASEAKAPEKPESSVSVPPSAPVVTEPAEEEAKRSPEDPKWRLAEDDLNAAREKLRHVTFERLPLWDTLRGEINAWAYAPLDPGGLDQGQNGSILSAWSGGAMTLALDQETLSQVNVVETDTRIDRPGDVANFFQVHWGTLASPALKNEFVLVAKYLDEERRAQRVAEIVGLPRGMKRVPNNPATATLRQTFAGVAVCCDLMEPQLDAFDEYSDWAGFSLRNTLLEDDEAIEAIADFVKTAERKGLKIYARDLPSRNLVTAAISLGVRYIFGEPVDPPAYSVERLIRPPS